MDEADELAWETLATDVDAPDLVAVNAHGRRSGPSRQKRTPPERPQDL